VKAADLGVDVAPRLKTLKITEPPKRIAGVMVPDVAALVAKTQERSKGDLTMSTLANILVVAEHDHGALKSANVEHRYQTRRG